MKEKQLSAIVTMHDLNLAMRFADKYLMLHDGEVFVAGGSGNHYKRKYRPCI